MSNEIDFENSVEREKLFRIASIERRVMNYLIDIAIIYAIMYAVMIWPSQWIKLGDAVSEGMTVVLFVGYYFVLEAWLQQTVGKLVTRTRVVMVDGSKPSLKTIFMRALIRLVPFEPFSFLLTKRDERTWWHDRWTGTRVVRKE